jgi:hypothetical protein
MEEALMAQHHLPCHPFADEATMRPHTDPRTLEWEKFSNLRWAEIAGLITIADDGSWEPTPQARAAIRAMFCTEAPTQRRSDA